MGFSNFVGFPYRINPPVLIRASGNSTVFSRQGEPKLYELVMVSTHTISPLFHPKLSAEAPSSTCHSGTVGTQQRAHHNSTN